MKKLLALLLILSCIMSLVGCGLSKTESEGLSPEMSDKELSQKMSDKEIEKITDRTKEEDIDCDTALEKFYEDDTNEYYFGCIMSEYVTVSYKDGSEENIKDALESGTVTMADLDRFEISYITEKKDVHEHKISEGNNIVEHEPTGYCGNTVTIVKYDPMGKGDEESWEKSFWGDKSVALTDLLLYLDYSGEVCRCLPEYTVDTEFGSGYGINLTEGYVRHNGGQVDLTAQQVEEIRSIMAWAAIEGDDCEDVSGVLQEPPVLTVICGTDSIEAMQGPVSWMYKNKDGTFTGIESDTMHPLDINSKKYMPVLEANQTSAVLEFEELPDSLYAHCWDVKHWGDTSADSEKAVIKSDKIELRKGEYLYEIIAEWDRGEDYGGTAYYYFCAKVY